MLWEVFIHLEFVNNMIKSSYIYLIKDSNNKQNESSFRVG